jgi:predicted alpha/beta-fold hydrolase
VHTAQATGADEAIEIPAPPWPGFEDVWIPINDRLQLAARLGLARRDGEPHVADCIVIIPGLLGDNAVRRTRDIGFALRDVGRHVLALELRGFGQTEARYPDVPYNFGVLETGDLLAVAEWLQEKPFVRDTGLMGFCWGANHALLAAWEDGRPADDPIVVAALRPYLRARSDEPHYRAGIIAFSPVLRFEEIIEELERDWSLLADPVLYTLQDGVAARMIRKQHPEISGNLRRLIEFEFANSELRYPQAVADGCQYLRFLPHRGKPAGDKLEHTRVPLLVVHGANDPLASVQAVAELFITLDNPQVAGVVLPGGGHVGFAPYARAYFYSLILNFFDPERGPAATQRLDTTRNVPSEPRGSRATSTRAAG